MIEVDQPPSHNPLCNLLSLGRLRGRPFGQNAEELGCIGQAVAPGRVCVQHSRDLALRCPLNGRRLRLHTRRLLSGLPSSQSVLLRWRFLVFQARHLPFLVVLDGLLRGLVPLLLRGLFRWFAGQLWESHSARWRFRNVLYFLVILCFTVSLLF